MCSHFLWDQVHKLDLVRGTPRRYKAAKWCLLSFSALFLMLPNTLLAFFACWPTLSWWSQTTVNSDFRISSVGCDSYFQVQHQGALVWITFPCMCYLTLIHREVLLPTAEGCQTINKCLTLRKEETIEMSSVSPRLQLYEVMLENLLISSTKQISQNPKLWLSL